MDSATAIAPRRVEPGRLLTLIDAIAGRRLLIVGDLIADEFIYGEIARVSREAPVLILNYDSTEVVPGGAGNAANNVAALGGAARIIGLTGRDETGRRLLATLKRRRVDVKDVLRPTGYTTPTKTRILAGGIHSAKQQVVRIDRASGVRVDARSPGPRRSGRARPPVDPPFRPRRLPQSLPARRPAPRRSWRRCRPRRGRSRSSRN